MIAEQVNSVFPINHLKPRHNKEPKQQLQKLLIIICKLNQT